MEEYLFRQDTIAAPSTPAGRGAVAVVRVSGPDTLKILHPLWLGRDLKTLVPQRFSLGRIKTSNGELIDEVLLVRMVAPHSYTGEEMAEIHCHGNPHLVKALLAELYRQGARGAEPGEFTFRAFRNGRMSLVQAESVAALIDAKGDWARKNALNVLAEDGDKWVRDLLDDLLAIWVPVEADLEFPTDDLDSLNLEDLLPPLNQLLGRMIRLREKAIRFSKLQEGYRVVIAGEPNAGKSSLLNALLGYQRAMVTDIPGTTRDTLEEVFEIEGIPIRLIDTAGLGEAKDELDAKGMERSRDALARADLAVVVIDASLHSRPEGELTYRDYLPAIPTEFEAPVLYAANKADLIEETSPWRGSVDAILVSALAETGLKNLLKKISETLTESGGVDLDERLMLNDRQDRTLTRAIGAIEMCIQNIDTGANQDLVATDLSEAKSALEELSGKTIQVDLMGEIFGKFCIGK
ncbi:MAG: tRNA uridine-5-carboxymethylaminomethyl(34) synthesis GTPase MnmE [Candidatus Omnitrophica bacterium]|nr:tRNA uridine-5-carboxymethylaminomethyl(34) synthesis GTPase MnmE [Candidatus Omnitrophota bacterium]